MRKCICRHNTWKSQIGILRVLNYNSHKQVFDVLMISTEPIQMNPRVKKNQKICV